MPEKLKCLIVDDEPTAREILENHLQKINMVQIVGSCKNAFEALEIIKQKPIDLIFLDINMPEISGLSFVKLIDKKTKVIFTTAYREYAVDGFDLQAVDYLLKPISPERLIQGINKFLDERIPILNEKKDFGSNTQNAFIFVRSERKMIKINFSDIRFVESFSDYLKIHLSEKTIVTRETISAIEAKLPSKLFFRTHRSFIVSFSKIDSFTNEYLEIGGQMIPISRSYKKSVLERLGKV